MTEFDERAAELAYQDAMLDSEAEAHAETWPDGCDRNCNACQRRLAARCDDGHEWPADYASGDTCWCGELYLIRLDDGRMKVKDR